MPRPTTVLREDPGSDAPVGAEEGDDAPSEYRHRRLHWWFVLLAGLPGLALVLLVPVGKPPDEIAHLDRIWTMAHGHLVPDVHADGDAGGPIPPCLASYQERTVPLYLSVPPLRLKQVLNVDSTCRGQDQEQYASFANSAVNSPITYAPQTVTVAVLDHLGVQSVRTTVYAGRLAALATYLALCGLAIALAPAARWVIFVIAGLPASLGLASTLSSDTVQLGLLVLAVSLLLRARAETGTASARRRTRMGLAAALLLLVLAKNANAPFLLLWLAVPPPLTGSSWRRWRQRVSVPLAGIVVAGAWALVVRDITTFPPSRVFAGIDPHGQLSWAVHHPLGFLAVLWRSVVSTEFFGGIAPRVLGRYPSGRPGPTGVVHSPPVPPLVLGAVLLALALAVAAAWGPRHRDHVRSLPWLWAVIGASSFVLVWLLVYAVSSPVAFPRALLVQGRYFTPLLTLLAPAVGTSRRSRSSGEPLVRVAAVAVPVLVALALFGEVAGAWMMYYR